MQKLSHDDGRKTQTQQRQCRLLKSKVHAVARRLGRFQCGRDSRRGISAFGESHHGAQHNQTARPRGQAAEADQHGKNNQGIDENLAPAESIRNVTDEYRGQAPGHGQCTSNDAHVLIIQAQLFCDHRKHRQQHESIDANQAKTQ